MEPSIDGEAADDQFGSSIACMQDPARCTNSASSSKLTCPQRQKPFPQETSCVGEDVVLDRSLVVG